MIQSERGAVIVQAAVAMTMLLAFGTFVVDYGMLWVSRSQAQTAADAAALAGAIGLAYDGGIPDPSETARAVALNSNLVWTQAPAPIASTAPCPPDASAGPCIRVEVYRNGKNGSAALPVLFGPIIDVKSQGVQATATAQVKVGDATNCLKPWAIPDKWAVHRPSDGPWTPTSQFQRYQSGQPLGTPLPTPPPLDEYIPPSATGTGTGLQTSDDPKTTLVLPPDSQIFPGRILPLDLPGGLNYAQSVESCVGSVIAVGRQIAISTTAVPALSDFQDLAAQDANASWSSGQITGSCAPVCAPVSPRLVPIALYDVDAYDKMLEANDWSGCPGGAKCITVANIAGFFIADTTGPGVDGFLTNYSGLVTVQDQLEVQSSFLKAITLIR